MSCKTILNILLVSSTLSLLSLSAITVIPSSGGEMSLVEVLSWTVFFFIGTFIVARVFLGIKTKHNSKYEETIPKPLLYSFKTFAFFYFTFSFLTFAG